jgi:hypothetical protein
MIFGYFVLDMLVRWGRKILECGMLLFLNQLLAQLPIRDVLEMLSLALPQFHKMTSASHNASNINLYVRPFFKVQKQRPASGAVLS